MGSTLTQVTPVSGSVYTVTVSGITGNGTLGLNLVDNGTIHDLAGNPLYEQNGYGSLSRRQPIFPRAAPHFAWHLADVNGDGKPDLWSLRQCGRHRTSACCWATATAPSRPSRPFVAGSDPYSVAVADVNGDGKPDLVVANMN